LRYRIEEEGSSSLHDELREKDPESAARIHPNDSTRIIRALEVVQASGITLSEHLRRQRENAGEGRFKRYISVGLTCERETLYRRINERTSHLFERGLEREVRGLLARGFGPELKSMHAIGYRHMVDYLEGRCSLEECKASLARDTRRYAKRQYTWFNRDQSIYWFDRDDAGEIFSYVEQSLSATSSLSG
jgi:tRNA dimethylallyltransferase